MLMILLSHILIALVTVALATFGAFVPSKFKLHATYALTVITLASGTLLAIIDPAQTLHACAAGAVYLTVVVATTVTARSKLIAAAQQI